MPETMEKSWKVTLWLIILVLILISAGCKSSEITSAIATIPPTLPSLSSETISPEITQSPISTTPEATPQPLLPPIERARYSIAVVLDYPNHRLDVEERILIPHPSNGLLNSIDLVVPPNNWPDVFIIHDISLGGMPVHDYGIDGVVLHIEIDDPGWMPGENLDLLINYSLELPQQNAREGFGPSPFGYSALQTNLVDWYPIVPPYQDGLGWIIHDPWLFGEYLVYPAVDFEISLKLGNSGLVTAASSAPLNEGDPIQYTLERARNFVFSFSPSYIVLEEELLGTRVYGYIFPGYQVPGQAAFDATVEALGLYTELYGPYDQPSLSMVQADFNHGMEYEGLYFQSKGFFDTYGGSVESYLVSIAVHETAHQWWYGQVANDQALEPWLDEAFCTFSELAFYENRYPESVDWWWGTRVNFYQPEGQIDRSIYDFQEYVDQYLNYRDATYLQGAKFLTGLKNEMGDEVFYDFLRAYAAQNKDGIVSSQTFFSLLEEYLDISSLDWIREYFPGL